MGTRPIKRGIRVLKPIEAIDESLEEVARHELEGDDRLSISM
jgi:hypothetical protein